MIYYCKFDANGKVTASVADFQASSFGGADKLIADGYEAVTDEHYQYYIGNQGTGKNSTGYVKGSDGSPTDAEAVTITLAQAIATAETAMDTAAAAAYIIGFSSSANGTALWYDSDKSAQEDLAKAAQAAAGTPEQFAAFAPNGYPVRAKASQSAERSTKAQYHLTAAQTIVLMKDWTTRQETVKEQKYTLEAKIYACTTAADVQAITISIT